MTGKSRASARSMSAWDKENPPAETFRPLAEGLEGTEWAATARRRPPGLPLELLHRQHDPPEGGVRDCRERGVPSGYRGRDADVPAGVHDALVGLGVTD